MKAIIFYYALLICAGIDFAIWQNNIAAGCFVTALGVIAINLAKERA